LRIEKYHDSGMNVFVAGATGVIGRPLLRLLRAAGYTVTGITRSAARAAALEALGARAAVINVFDPAALMEAVAAAKPDVVINQLTDLPDARDPALLAASRACNARIRIEGTRNLMTAARAAGAKRAIGQSIAFAYAPGPAPLRETDPLDDSEAQRVTVEGVIALERQTLETPGIDGVVLRYGRLYGPGTWFEKPEGRGALSTEAAAQAALLAVTRGSPGIYNVAEDDGALSIEKARRELGFDPSFRLS
jgi:nucleoside-diphosphate-sugar epimerase